MSRSSVVYGPFGVVRLGVVVLTMMLHKYKDRDDRYIFLFGTVVGGAYEYICSVFHGESPSAPYSGITANCTLVNLGGRINLLYCFFCLACVIWIKLLSAHLGLIERVPVKG